MTVAANKNHEPKKSNEKMKNKPNHTIMKRPIRTRVNALAIAASMVLLISSHTANAQNVGIGTPTPTTKLDVNGGALFRSTAGGPTGHVKILSSGSVAGQGGLLLTQVAGYTAGTGAFKLYNTATGGLNGSLHIAHVDQGTPDAVTNLVTIRAGGNVGIGTTAPSQKLDVAGNLQFSGALMPAGNPGTSDQVLTSQGAGSAPVWKSISSIPGMWRLVYVDSWDATNNTTQGWSGAAVTDCGGQYMLGGYGQCGSGCILSKTFSSLPPHTEVMVKVYYWKVDSWDQNSNWGVDKVYLRLAGNTVAIGIPAEVDISANENSSNASFCGVSWVDDGPFPLVGRITHSASSLLVEIVSGLNEASTNESLGIVAVEVWCK